MKRNDYGDEYEPRIESGYVSIRTLIMMSLLPFDG